MFYFIFWLIYAKIKRNNSKTKKFGLKKKKKAKLILGTPWAECKAGSSFRCAVSRCGLVRPESSVWGRKRANGSGTKPERYGYAGAEKVYLVIAHRCRTKTLLGFPLSI